MRARRYSLANGIALLSMPRQHHQLSLPYAMNCARPTSRFIKIGEAAESKEVVPEIFGG
jgi:hypothetical protein